MARSFSILFIVLWAIAFPCRAFADGDSTAAPVATDPSQAMLDAAADAAIKDSTLEKKDWAAVGDDTLAVRTAGFDTSAIRQLKADPDYDYDKNLHNHTLWWDVY